MRTLLLCLIAISCGAQNVSFNFRKWSNLETREIIIDSKDRFSIALSQTAFTDSDNIRLAFDFRNEYVVVTHNLPEDSERIDILSKQVLLHIAFLRQVAAHYKVQNLRIYIRLRKDLYLFYDNEEVWMKGKKVKMKDKLFKAL